MPHEIADTDFVFPDFAMTDYRTPRQVIEAANAPHNYITKVGRGRSFIFRPRPTVPLFTVGEWPGAEFNDTSKNDAEPIYNRVRVLGTGEAGQPIEVERWAGQQPGVMLEAVDTPSITNPSFTTDVSGWTVANGTLVRDTVTFFSSPASGKLTATDFDAHAKQTMAGTFARGVLYVIKTRARAVGGFAFGGFNAHVGTKQLDGDGGVLPADQWVDLSIAFVLSSPSNAVELAFAVDLFGASVVVLWDDFEIWSARPTLVDRRGFVRTRTHSMGPAITTDVGRVIADTLIRAHMKTPMRGDLAVTGRGGVRRYKGGASVDPFELGMHTGELIHFANEIDPDTGNLGRDGEIAAVSYNGNEESAQVASDSQRDNFEAVMSRYELVVGGR